MWKWFESALVVAAVVALAAGTTYAADNQHTTDKLGRPLGQGAGRTVVAYDVPSQVPEAPRADTIQYDTGVANSFLATGPARSVGNRFNSRNGNPLPGGGLLTQVQWMQGGLSGSSAYVSFYGAPNASGTASVIGGILTPAVMGLNTVTVSYAVGSDFLIGLFNAVGTSPVDAGPTSLNHVDFDAGNTVGGQGYHAMSIGSTWSPYGYTDIPSMNAIIRATGTNLPVELMGFDID